MMNLDRSPRNSTVVTTTLFIILLLGIVVSTAAAADDGVLWNPCSLHTEFDMPDGIKFFPRANLTTGKLQYTLSMIDAINEINLKNNLTFITQAECAMVSVPFNHDDTNNSKPLKLFVKRLRANPNKQAPRALWLLSGGPGMASNIWEMEMDLLVKMFGGQFDIYTTDHRGTGRSNRATCTTTQAETIGSDEGITISMKEWTKNGCAQSFNDEWNGQTQHFSSKSAAIDMIKLIQLINTPQSQKTFVYGASYGSVWVSRIIRYLQLNGQESLISGYIMDGVVNVIGKPAPMGLDYTTKTGRMVLNLWDENFNAVGNALMEICGGNKSRIATNQFVDANSDNTLNTYNKLYDEETECAKKLEKKAKGNPVEYMKNVIESVYVNNTCRPIADGIPLLQLKTLFQSFISDSYLRFFVPAFIYRMDRCDEDVDIPFLLHIRDVFEKESTFKPKSVPLESPVLQSHIVYSELWDKKTTMQQLLNEYNSSEINFGGIVIGMQSLLEATQWPTYDLDQEYFEQAYETTVPILMLNGNLDPNTPLWSALSQQANIKGNSHNLVIVPFSAHGTIVGPTFNNSYIPAGLQIVVNFVSMETPNALTVDTSCLDLIDFNSSGVPYYNERVFGIYNIYEDSYIAESANPEISVYFLVGIFIAILFIACVVCNLLIYYIIKLKDEYQYKQQFGTVLVEESNENQSTPQEISPYQSTD